MKSEKLQLKINNKFLKLCPIIFIIAVWLIFASPYFLKNKVPFPSTYQVNNFAPWSAYEKFWGPVKNGAMPDIITQIYPWRNLVIETWKSGQIPLWNPYSFAGNPLLANYQSAALSPFNLLFFIIPFVDAWSIFVLIQPLLAGFFMYIFVRSLLRSKFASLISSISFMFCGFITAWMGYATLGYALLFLPLALFCVEKYYQTKQFLYLFLLAFTIPLSFFSGHFQISLYFLITLLAYIFFKLISSKTIHITFYLLLYIFFGLLMSMPQILPSIELYLHSFRSDIFQTSEAIPFEYLPTIFAPDFFGNPVTRNDWFGHYAEWAGFIGILPLTLSMYAIFKKDHRIIFFLIVGVLSLISAIDNPLSSLIVSLKIPVISTSALSRVIVLFSFSFAVLSAFGLDVLREFTGKRNIKKIIVPFLILGTILVCIWGILLVGEIMSADKITIAKRNFVLPTIFFGIATASVLLSVFDKKFAFVALFILLLTASFDSYRFAQKWMPFDPRNLVFPKTETSESFSKISGFNRALGNLGGEASIYYKLPSVEGYDALHMKRYAEFISFIEDGKPRDLNRSVVIFPKNGLHTPKAINLLNIRYIVHKLADDQAGWTFPYWRYPKNQFRLIYKDKKYEFYENTESLPHAFLVGKYRIIKDPNKIIEEMFSDKFDLRTEVILEQDPGIKNSEGKIGTVNINAYTPNKISLSVNARKEGVLFMSDNYFKGWKAEINGVEVPIYRANYTFRALAIREGKHTVVLIYDPLSFKFGILLAGIGLFGISSIFWLPKILNPLNLIFSSRSQKDRQFQGYQ